MLIKQFKEVCSRSFHVSFRPAVKMLCQECGKANASVHVTRIINGEKTEAYLCENCAKEKGEFEFSFEGKFPLHQFFSEIMGGMPSGESSSYVSKPSGQTQCQVCGLSYAQFGQIGKLGCGKCYEAFEDKLLPLFRRLHGNQQHMGKVPARGGAHLKIKKQVENLREKLQQKIAEEAFEEAAEIRDELRRLEKQVEPGGEGNG